MQRSHTRTILLISLIPVLLALVSLDAFARVKRTKAAVVKIGEPAPNFNVRTLEGVTYNNASLSGGPTLLQFWTTWCPHCRSDQAAVDEIDSKFAGQGLVVLAINQGESAAKVNEYLREHPRNVRIVLDERKQIAKRFGARGYPYYVLIDRQGRIAGTQRGAEGQQGLISLLKRAGLQERQPAEARSTGPKARVLDVTQDTAKGGTQEGKRNDKRGANQGTDANNRGAAPGAVAPKQAGEGTAGEQAAAAEEPRKPSGMKVIEIEPDKKGSAGQPLPKAVFVLTNGERLESDRYRIDAKFLHVAVEGEERIVPMNSVDVQATEAANRARGLDLKMPHSKSEVFVSF